MKQIIIALTEKYPDDKNFIKNICIAFNNVSIHGFDYEIGFLDSHKINIIELISNNYKDCILNYSINFLEQEKKFVYISKIQKNESKTVILNIVYNKKYGLIRHQDVLGFLMNNDYNVFDFGDIVVDELGNVNIIVSAAKIGYFINTITEIGKFKVNLETVEKLTAYPTYNDTFIVICSSLRIDNVVSSLVSISRAKSIKLIKSKFVNVNHCIIRNYDTRVNTSNIISIKQHGRFIIEDITRTKKGNYRLSVR